MKWWVHWPRLNVGQGVMAAVPQGGCLAPRRQPSVLGKLLPTRGTRPGPMPGGPVVTASCDVLRHHSLVPGWTQHLLWEASTSALSPIWEKPPVLVPFANTCWSDVPPPRSHCSPRLQDPCCQHGGQQDGFPLLACSRSLRKPAPYIRVSSETQDLGSHAAGRAVAQLGLIRPSYHILNI